MPECSAPLMAKGMDPIKNFGKWIITLCPFLREKSNNETQGNNKIITITKKDREHKTQPAVSAGKLQMWAKGYCKVHKVSKEAI